MVKNKIESGIHPFVGTEVSDTAKEIVRFCLNSEALGEREVPVKLFGNFLDNAMHHLESIASAEKIKQLNTSELIHCISANVLSRDEFYYAVCGLLYKEERAWRLI